MTVKKIYFLRVGNNILSSQLFMPMFAALDVIKTVSISHLFTACQFADGFFKERDTGTLICSGISNTESVLSRAEDLNINETYQKENNIWKIEIQSLLCSLT